MDRKLELLLYSKDVCFKSFLVFSPDKIHAFLSFFLSLFQLTF